MPTVMGRQINSMIPGKIQTIQNIFPCPQIVHDPFEDSVDFDEKNYEPLFYHKT